MQLLIIIAIIWAASALVRTAQERNRQREIERMKREAAQRSAEQARMREEMRRQQAEAKDEAKRVAALEREQIRQAKEQARIAKEQEKQAEQLAKHEERLLRLEQKLELAARDEEHWANEAQSIRIDMAGLEAYVEYYKAKGFPCKAKEDELKRKAKELYTAETKQIKARQARELCESKLSA